jgi:hypothetical protein
MPADGNPWVDCPELITRSGSALVRCSLPAEVLRTESMRSTRGHVLHLQTRCLRGHFLFFPAELLND